MSAWSHGSESCLSVIDAISRAFQFSFQHYMYKSIDLFQLATALRYLPPPHPRVQSCTHMPHCPALQSSSTSTQPPVGWRCSLSTAGSTNSGGRCVRGGRRGVGRCVRGRAGVARGIQGKHGTARHGTAWHCSAQRSRRDCMPDIEGREGRVIPPPTPHRILSLPPPPLPLTPSPPPTPHTPASVLRARVRRPPSPPAWS